LYMIKVIIIYQFGKGKPRPQSGRKRPSEARWNGSTSYELVP
jgi:hypothetical protein